MSAPPLVLYDAPGSPCARRVRISLLEKGLPWDTVIVDLSRLEQKRPEYLRLNPNGVVPTLVHGERVVYESNVITEYLDDVFPDLRLYPDDPWERAQVSLWQAFELSFAKDYRPLMYQRLLGPMVRLTRTLEQALETARRSTSNPFDLEWERKVWSLAVLSPAEEDACAARLYARVEVLERALAGRDYLVGDRFGQAEISLFPRLRMYPYVQLPIRAERFPRVAAWMARLERRPSFERSLFDAERGMQRLAATGVVPWIASRLRRAQPSLLDRAGLALARAVFARALAPRDEAAAARAQAARRAAREDRGTELADGVRAPQASASAGRVGAGGASGSGTSEPPAARGRGRAAAVGAGSAPAGRGALGAALVLYDSPLSPSCRRVRIALRALGLEWQTRPVDLARMEQKTAAILALNPNGEVPILLHGERVLYDSALIGEYLDAAFAGGERAGLLPRDPYERAQTRMWIAYDQGAHKEWRPLLYHTILGSESAASPLPRAAVESGVRREAPQAGAPREAPQAEARPEAPRSGVRREAPLWMDEEGGESLPADAADWLARARAGTLLAPEAERLVRHELLRRLERVEARLAAADWLVGDALTAADVAWFSRLEMYPRLGLPLDAGQHPGIARWLERLRALPAFA